MIRKFSFLCIRPNLLFSLGLAAIAGIGHAQQETWQDPATGLTFTKIEAGCFDMGAAAALPDKPSQPAKGPRHDETPRHRVCLDAFWIGRYEVTEAQWQRLMSDKDFKTDISHGDRAKSNISFIAARSLLDRINSKSKTEPRYRLPTEAEWEYACRANDVVAPFAEQTGENEEKLAELAWHEHPPRADMLPAPVGRKTPNAWGLHDMLGNVWEWTADAYYPDAYGRHTARNPRITDENGKHVIRGGSFKSRFWQTRCGVRSFGLADDPLPTVGLRLVVDNVPIDRPR